MEPLYFATPAEWRAWLLAHHATRPELWVGFYKKASGRASITWPESVDHALCFGWIDGIRKRVDQRRYVIRFTPRRPGSVWSAVNTRRVAELEKEGLMHPTGRAAFGKKTASRSGIYAYEQQRKTAALGRAHQALFKAEPAAWDFFRSQPPSYRRTSSWWVISAKQETTRLRRLNALIRESARGRRIEAMAPRAP